MSKFLTLLFLLFVFEIGLSKNAESSDDDFLSICGDQFCYKDSPIKLKGYNFDRRNLPSWWLHASEWDETAIINDLNLAKNYGANTIRVLLPYANAFSDLEGNISNINKDRLVRFIQLAKSQGLKVTITLFSWFADDSNWPYDWPQEQTDFNSENSSYKNSFTRIDNYLNQIISLLKDEKGVLSWGIINEPEGSYWDRQNNREGWKLPWIFYFIRHVRNYIKTVDNKHLITTGVVFPFTLSNKYNVGGDMYSLGDLSDYLSIHMYPKNDNDISSQIRFIKQENLGKPIVIEEIGWPTADFRNSNGWPEGTSNASDYTEDKQYQRINAGLLSAKSDNIAGFIVWNLFDLDKETNPTKFGLFNSEGFPKRAAALMQNMELFPYTQFNAVNLPDSPLIPKNFPGCNQEIDWVVSDNSEVIRGCNSLGQNCSSLVKQYPPYMECHAKYNSLARMEWDKFGPACSNPYCTCACLGGSPPPEHKPFVEPKNISRYLWLSNYPTTINSDQLSKCTSISNKFEGRWITSIRLYFQQNIEMTPMKYYTLKCHQ